MVAVAQAVVEHVGSVATKRAVAVAAGCHDGGVGRFVVLCSHGRHCAKREGAVGLLDNLVAYQRSTPCRLVAVAGTNVGVLLVDVGTCAERTPAPDVAVLTVRGCLASIEGTAVKHSLMTVGRPLRSVIEAVLQFLVGLRHHVLHLAAP